MGGSVSEPRELSGGKNLSFFFLTPVPTLPCRRAAQPKNIFHGRVGKRAPRAFREGKFSYLEQTLPIALPTVDIETSADSPSKPCSQATCPLFRNRHEN